MIDPLTNPRAFPRPASVGNNYVTGEEGVVVDPQSGMTLLDYFAAKAMAAYLAQGDGQREAAIGAYNAASEMLNVRRDYL